ncbi:MAG: hypothetical protein LBD21_00225, partial [Tannerellaceae bacterium]|nr:hypothetical protein [Tannerellaceae bacterium]
MKKSISICIAMSLISFLGTAQVKNVDVDNVGLEYVSRGLPTQPQDPVYFEYTARVISVGVAKNYVALGEIADAMYIEGQKKIGDPEQSLLHVELALGNIVIKSSDVKERKEEDKDKNGNVTKTVHYYKMVVEYYYEAVYRIYKDGKLHKTGSALSRSTFRYESEEYKTHKAAVDFWTNNKDAHVSNFYILCAGNALEYLNTMLSEQYGFPIKKKYDIIKHIDTKKHDENTPFRAAAAALKAEIEAMTADKAMNRSKVEPLIEYFRG